MRFIMQIVTLLFFFLCTISASFAQGDLSATLKGQQSSSKLTVGTIEIPNNLATKTGSIAALIETGNNNLLSNPSFEHSNYSTSWTLGGTGTYSAETSTLIHGKKALKVVTSSQTVSLTQDSTLYQAQFADSVQCEASVKIKTDSTVAPVICARQAATTSTIDCVTAANDNKWATYTIPFICKGTSNGVAIDIASATGTTYIDDAYVGVPKNLSTSSAIGPWISYTPTWTAVTTNPVIGNGTIFGSYSITGDSIMVTIRITSGSTTTYGSGDYVFSIPSQFTINTSKLSENTNNTLVHSTASGLDSSASTNYVGVVKVINSTSVRVSGQGTTNNWRSSTPFTWATSDVLELSFLVPVNELNGNVTTYSAPANANNENVFSAYIGSDGTVTQENVDWIEGNAVVSDTSQYVVTFKTGIFSATPICTTAAVQSSTIAAYISKVQGGNSTTVTTRIFDNSNTKIATGHSLVCQKSSADYKASRSIVGSFKDNVISKGSSQLNIMLGNITCSSSSAIDNNIGSWISSAGNITAGACTITLNSGVFGSAPYCMATWGNSSFSNTTASTVGVTASSATSIRTDCATSSGDCTSYSVRLLCWEGL